MDFFEWCTEYPWIAKCLFSPLMIWIYISPNNCIFKIYNSYNCCSYICQTHVIHLKCPKWSEMSQGNTNSCENVSRSTYCVNEGHILLIDMRRVSAIYISHANLALNNLSNQIHIFIRTSTLFRNSPYVTIDRRDSITPPKLPIHL